MGTSRGAVHALIERWDDAWNQHDADALAQLHHPDAETVNRFGQYVHGREEHRQQLRWLHTGPFKGSQSPLQKVFGLRWIRPGIASIQLLDARDRAGAPSALTPPDLHLAST